MSTTISHQNIQKQPETALTRNKKIAAVIIGIVVLAALITLIVCSTQTTSVAEHKASLLQAQGASSPNTKEILEIIGYVMLGLLFIICFCAAIANGGCDARGYSGGFTSGFLIGSLF